MMNLKNKLISLAVFGFSLLSVSAQTTNTPEDSLSLQDAIQKILATHPSVKEAEEAINIADANINLAKSAYMPDVDVTASYSHIGPVSVIDIPTLGKFQFYPADNYAASLNYKQTLYDFGKTSNNVKLEQENKNLSSQNIDLVKQRLALATVNSYYAVVFLQEAIRIKNDELKNLQDHLQFIEKKQSTGSATSYELLITRVKLSNTQSQKTDLETAQKTQSAVLNSLLGQPISTISKVKKGEAPLIPELVEDSLLNYAYTHRIEMAISKEKETLAVFRYNMVKSQNNPVFSFQASGGAKNGYEPELNKVHPNYVVGVGLRVPIFDGFRLKNNLSQVQAAINTTAMESDLTRRNIANEVIENESNKNASFTKIGQFELQVQQAKEAYELAKISYQAGVITNLDLLDAETGLSESYLLLLKARIDYSVAIYRLKTSLGDKLY